MTPSRPLVSVIIPCHNASRWLRQTLESAVAQTWAPTEIIVVDDGSSDDSAAIARCFESRGVRVATQPNRGASAARNHGLRLASGAFIQFLDADDLISEDKIWAQVDLLLRSPPGCVASCRWGRFEEDPARTRFVDDSVFRDYTPARDFLVQAAGTGDMIQPAAWLCRRPLLDAAGPWDEALSLNDDGEYFCRVLTLATGIRFAAAGCVHYRSALPCSLSRRRSRRALESYHRSHVLFSDRLLAAEDTPRVREALSNYWERCRFELYPGIARLSGDAAARARALGSPSAKPQFGRRMQIVASAFGWRVGRRLQEWLTRNHSKG